MLVDFLNSDKLIVAGKVLDKDYKVYQLVCSKGNFIAKEIVDSEVSGLAYLNDRTIFYSDNSGSYFYDLVDDSKVKYTALGSNTEVIVSDDKKYIGAMVNGKFLIVDYPAVVASGVEKHYVIPFQGSELSFISSKPDQILINQSKICESDGDCGEILRVNLFGSGAWRIEDRIQLKDVKPMEILGEISL